MLITTRLDDCDSMEDFVNKIISNAHKLRGAGMTINDEWVGTLLLAGLGVKYEPMIMAIENSGIPISADQIKVKLLQETSKNGSNCESSMYTRKSNQNTAQSNAFQKGNVSKNGGNGGRSNQKARLKCFKCQREGHFARDCRVRRSNDENNQSNQRGQDNTERNWSCLTGKYDPAVWYIDSGATAHMTCKREFFSELHESNSATVTVANNTSLKVRGEGVVKLSTANTNVTVHKVLYVPEICANLLSVSEMTKKGNRLNFHENGCDIEDVHSSIIAKSENVNGMFRLNAMSTTMASAGFLATNQNSSARLWHKRLGHIGFDYLRRMNEQWKTDGTPCDVCILGKQTSWWIL